jgi:cell division protein FtsB
MPYARAQAARHRETRRTPARPRRVARPRARIRWDRLGRTTLLIVLVIVAGLYVQHTLSYLSTRSQTDEQVSIVRQLTRDNARLLRQQRALNNPATIAQDARALGMVRPGERPYVVTGLKR